MMRRAPCLKLSNGKEIRGTVSWEEYIEAYEQFLRLNAHETEYRFLSAERLAERGGFGYPALRKLLGRLPETWEPDVRTSRRTP